MTCRTDWGKIVKLNKQKVLEVGCIFSKVLPILHCFTVPCIHKPQESPLVVQCRLPYVPFLPIKSSFLYVHMYKQAVTINTLKLFQC